MPIPSLDDAWRKLRWAKSHYDMLRIDIESFQQSHDHSMSLDVNPDTGEYIFRVHGLESLEERDWGLIIGDVIHNARCALDYLIVQLIAFGTGRDPREITERSAQFPICSDPGSFSDPANKLKKLMLPGHFTRIEELQPFNALDPSIWGSSGYTPSSVVGRPNYKPTRIPPTLAMLNDFNNIDKHRVVNAVWHEPAWFQAPNPSPPPDFVLRGTSTSAGPLEDGAEVGRWIFRTPLPRDDWRPSEVDVKSAFPLYISMGDRDLFQPVPEILASMLWAVEAVLGLFAPVFGPPVSSHPGSSRQSLPPLPVYAARPPSGGMPEPQ